jgi:hypothetical protein
MLSHMRTTLDLPDPLYRKAKKLARERGVPFRELMAEALRLLFRETAAKKKPYELKDTAVGGSGLVDGLSWNDWDSIRELSYER